VVVDRKDEQGGIVVDIEPVVFNPAVESVIISGIFPSAY